MTDGLVQIDGDRPNCTVLFVLFSHILRSQLDMRKLTARSARKMAAQRKTIGAGAVRPRENKPRCAVRRDESIF